MDHHEIVSVQLLDLPDELVLLILDHIDPNALLYLAMLCRRLHYISLPIYFMRNGINNPAESAECTMLDSRRDPLSALQMALFIPHITELSCSLPHYETSIHPLFPRVRRLASFLRRLTFVRKVTLELDTPSGLGGDSGDHIETWALEFRDLLNTILKRGCISLTLRYGRFFSNAPELHHFRRVVRPVHVLRNAMGAHAVVPMELDPEACSVSALTHFHIESSMLLLPPCFSWSLSVLQHSPITCLEFLGTTLPTKIWSAVLPPMASLVPALTELKLSNLYGISGVDILLFLVKLPRLKILTIGYTEYSRSIQSSFPDSGPIPKLHELTSLHAPSTFISHTLKKKNLPSLESLCIAPRRLILGSRGMRHIARSVSDIVHRLEKYKLAPTVSLEIHRGQDSDTEMAADLALVPSEDLMKSLRAITRLIVHSDSDIPAPEFATLARWIARFPALVHVSLRVRSAPHEGWATPDMARTILSQQSPTVKSLELNGTLFDAGNTLKPVAREIPPFIGV
ncbi:hypothetical protein B0H17DRAFT_21175 [Mycena rosella]|uniref:F-box domain-containing protein n=1 Tax=Mycena rosella TaxID=1033263 RepID=A0AAD7GET5_MYCRO|nr:hypothetical protein B0H17DRAFT_21175 [Mycena rosella]